MRYVHPGASQCIFKEEELRRKRIHPEHVTILCAGGVGGETRWILTFPLLGFLNTTKSLSTAACHPMMLCVTAGPTSQGQNGPDETELK